MWRIRKDGGLARADRVATLREKARRRSRSRRRPTRCSASRAARPRPSAPRRSRRRDLTVNAVPDLVAPRGDRPCSAPSRCQHPGRASSARRSRSRPTRWSRRTRRRRPGTSSGCRRSSPTRRSRSARFTVNGAFLGGVILPGLLLGLLTVWPWLDRSPAAATGRLVPAQPAEAERRVPARRRWSSSCSPSSARSCAGRTGTSTGPGRRGRSIPDEDLTMEKRTDSPYPRLDRPVLAVIGLVLVVATVLFAAQRPRARLALLPGRSSSSWWPRSSAPTRRGPSPPGMQQIWVPGLGRADRCTTCHQAINWKGFEAADHPWRTHPPEILELAPARDVRLHLLPRRPGLGDRHRAGPRRRRTSGRSRSSARRWARPTRSSTTRTR